MPPCHQRAAASRSMSSKIARAAASSKELPAATPLLSAAVGSKSGPAVLRRKHQSAGTSVGLPSCRSTPFIQSSGTSRSSRFRSSASSMSILSDGDTFRACPAYGQVPLTSSCRSTCESRSAASPTHDARASPSCSPAPARLKLAGTEADTLGNVRALAFPPTKRRPGIQGDRKRNRSVGSAQARATDAPWLRASSFTSSAPAGDSRSMSRSSNSATRAGPQHGIAAIIA